jgi:hypothetical protein
LHIPTALTPRVFGGSTGFARVTEILGGWDSNRRTETKYDVSSVVVAAAVLWVRLHEQSGLRSRLIVLSVARTSRKPGVWSDTFIEDIFGGVLTSTVLCDVCSVSSCGWDVPMC